MINYNDLPIKYANELESCLDADMNRQLHTIGLDRYEDTDTEYAKEFDALGIEIYGDQYEFTVIKEDS